MMSDTLGNDPDVPVAQAGDHLDEVSYLVFRLGASLYALPAEYVEHVASLVRPVRVPTAPKYFLGVVHLRGRVFAAVDLRALLSAGAAEGEASNYRLLAVHASGKPFAIPVDSVVGLRSGAYHKSEEKGGLDRAALVAGQIDIPDGVVTVLSAEALVAGLSRDSAEG